MCHCANATAKNHSNLTMISNFLSFRYMYAIRRTPYAHDVYSRPAYFECIYILHRQWSEDVQNGNVEKSEVDVLFAHQNQFYLIGLFVAPLEAELSYAALYTSHSLLLRRGGNSERWHFGTTREIHNDDKRMSIWLCVREEYLLLLEPWEDFTFV